MTEHDFAKVNRWLLPDGVDEILPPQAFALERLRRELLDCYYRWGYDLVMPPTIEYLEALLTGVAHDLDLQTFKLTDQLTGRMMGVRADITPQAARIDAHQLRRDCPVRLCYLGTVLQTRPEGPGSSRNPLQIGAELYGHAGFESDAEIIALMLETLRIAGVVRPHLDLGHVGIFRGLTSQAGLDPGAEMRLWDALQRKAGAEIEAVLTEFDVAEPLCGMLAALPELSGGLEVLERANADLMPAQDCVQQALRELRSIANALQHWLPDVPLHFDLGELRGYQYHTGVVFAAFVAGHSHEVARGGRYNHIGRVFGRSRPATGFSADLKTLFALSDRAQQPPVLGVAAPCDDDAALLAEVNKLRQAGERVIWLLPGHEAELHELGCDRKLVNMGGCWQVKPA
ncbi:MAG: ATP phosphoribosyltransferase regulatory subunit [Nitrococcus mobilis]|nr:ATP phosphoribosyltransferase regulatory subunit [Nitrococcus mobilis]